MTTTRLPKTITAGALLATPIPPVKWIIPGLLPAGLAIFAGPSKAGKSWLTLWLCLQISQGKSVWGREIEPRTVLYFSLEDTLGRLQERLYQLVDAEEDPERLILQTESHGIGQGLEEQIVSFIHTYPDINLMELHRLCQLVPQSGVFLAIQPRPKLQLVVEVYANQLAPEVAVGEALRVFIQKIRAALYA